MSHPVDAVYVNDVVVSKATVRSYSKEYLRHRVGNADDIRNNNWSGQFGGIYVAALGAEFYLDTSDTTTPDDGVNCIHDNQGNRFFRAAEAVFTPVQLVVAASGNVTLDDDEDADIIFINNTSGGPIDVFLPSAAVRTKEIAIYDGDGAGGGNAGTYQITVKPKSASGQTLMTGASYPLDVNGAGINLKPLVSGGGWF